MKPEVTPGSLSFVTPAGTAEVGRSEGADVRRSKTTQYVALRISRGGDLSKLRHLTPKGPPASK